VVWTPCLLRRNGAVEHLPHWYPIERRPAYDLLLQPLGLSRLRCGVDRAHRDCFGRFSRPLTMTSPAPIIHGRKKAVEVATESARVPMPAAEACLIPPTARLRRDLLCVLVVSTDSRQCPSPLSWGRATDVLRFAAARARTPPGGGLRRCVRTWRWTNRRRCRR